MSCALRWTLILGLLICVTPALALDAPLRLCTATGKGNYYAAGQEIARQAKLSGIVVEVLETEGSMDNLQRMAEDSCDGAIVQMDAYLVYQQANRGDRLEIVRPQYLYDEYVHLACERGAGITSIGDLPGKDAKLLVGSETSGGAITWESFKLENPSYYDVATENVGGDAALERLRQGEASCMLHVSGLRSPYLQEVAGYGEELRLASIDDEKLGEAEVAGHPVYSFREIPADVYPGLQDGAELPTVTVRAMLIVSDSWAAEFANKMQALREGVTRAVGEFRKNVSTP
jgi:TRAP transporter TAXI family solute receptor